MKSFSCVAIWQMMVAENREHLFPGVQMQLQEMAPHPCPSGQTLSGLWVLLHDIEKGSRGVTGGGRNSGGIGT